MKKLFLLSILILLLFVLLGCRSDEPNEVPHIEQPAEEIISEPKTQPEPAAQVYEQPIVLNEISFTFENREVESRHAERVDIIRSGAIEYFNLHRRPSHVVFTNDERTEIGHNTVRINPDSPHDIPDGVLLCYSASGSFVMFLLEIGSLEDYMQFRSGRDAAQKIYGIDLYQLIEMWKYEHLQFDYWREIFSEFLMDFIENLLSFWESFRESN